MAAQVATSAYIGVAWRVQLWLGVVTSSIVPHMARGQRSCRASFGFAAVGVFQSILDHPRSGSVIGLGLSGSVGIEGVMPGLRLRDGCGPWALVSGRGLSFLPSSSIIQDNLPYLSSGRPQ